LTRKEEDLEDLVERKRGSGVEEKREGREKILAKN
jgi:hypothetical protein